MCFPRSGNWFYFVLLYFESFLISAARHPNGQAHHRRRVVRCLSVRYLETAASENSFRFLNVLDKFSNSVWWWTSRVWTGDFSLSGTWAGRPPNEPSVNWTTLKSGIKYELGFIKSEWKNFLKKPPLMYY